MIANQEAAINYQITLRRVDPVPPEGILSHRRISPVPISILLRKCLCLAVFLSCSATPLLAQDTLPVYNLNACIRYALTQQPAVRQAAIDQSIARTTNRIALSAGLPQASLNATQTDYFSLPTVFLPNTANPGGDRIRATTALSNVLLPNFTVSQALFSNDVLTAVRTAPLVTQQAREAAESTRINTITDVSLAFYDVLLSQSQLQVYAEDTARLGHNLRDAYAQYVAGIVDKVDYKRATIALNNSAADLRNAGESVQGKLATLKRQMGYPPTTQLRISVDTSAMTAGILLDTGATLRYGNRVEFRLLETARRLQEETTSYYRLGFLPTLTASYSYVPQFQSSQFSTLYSQVYPYSFFGLNLTLPIFQGFRRLENLRRSKLYEDRLYWSDVALQLQVNDEYQNAIAAYRSNLNSYLASKANTALAQEVYDVIRLQYREGIKQYLEVIVAQSDLRNAQINYQNALYQLLQSRVSLQRALGTLSPEDQ